MTLGLPDDLNRALEEWIGEWYRGLHPDDKTRGRYGVEVHRSDDLFTLKWPDGEPVLSFGVDLDNLHWKANYAPKDERPQEERRPIAARQAVTVPADDVVAEAVDWLWPAWLPRGKLVVLDGDPGTGKSTLLVDLVSRLSTAAHMPDGSRNAARRTSIILSAEDGLADTIRPRLDAAGADLGRIHALVGVIDSEGPTRPWSLPGDVDLLAERVAALGADLVILDPLMAFLHGSRDSYRDQDVRGALHPLGVMADRAGATVVAVRHLTKAGGPNAIYRGGGSIGIIGAARAAWLVAPDPDDDDRRILAVSKSNLAQVPPSLAYQLASDDGRGCARIEWQGATDHTASGLLVVTTAEERSELDGACDVLRTILRDGPVAAKAAQTEAQQTTGASIATLRRAKDRLGIKSERQGGVAGEGYWSWTLP